MTSKVSKIIEDQGLTVLVKVIYHGMNIIIDSIACPFMVLLNVLVVSAVKSRPEAFRANQISCLLVRLSVTDAVSGLMRQPTFIFATTLKLFVIR